MGIFDFLKTKKTGNVPQVRDLIVQGPGYLRPHLVAPDSDLIDRLRLPTRKASVYVRQISTPDDRKLFTIKYHGNLHKGETIDDTDDAVKKLIAVSPDNGSEILLFDKMIHGWEGFVCDRYADQKRISRNLKKFVSADGADIFRIVFIAYYNDGTKSELLENADSDGNVTLENGAIMNIQDAFDNAFDAVIIYVIDENGKVIEIVNDELA